MADEEQALEGAIEESAGAEFVPEAAVKPKSDVYTVLLLVAFLAFVTGSILAGRELWEVYDVQFWAFAKNAPSAQQAPPSESPEEQP